LGIGIQCIPPPDDAVVVAYSAGTPSEGSKGYAMMMMEWRESSMIPVKSFLFRGNVSCSASLSVGSVVTVA